MGSKWHCKAAAAAAAAAAGPAAAAWEDLTPPTSLPRHGILWRGAETLVHPPPTSVMQMFAMRIFGHERILISDHMFMVYCSGLSDFPGNTESADAACLTRHSM